MRAKISVLLFVASLVVVAGALRAPEAGACATLYAGGTSAGVATENTLIVWNEEKKLEHFIRQITFDASTANVGFLVPTPTRPSVFDADEGVFKRLEQLSPPMLTASAPGVRSAGSGAVSVLEEKRVAGMDMAVLEASDATALAEWLKKNSFSSRPALDKWLEPYVKAHFKLVAFKYVKEEAGAPKLAAKAVRITFATPYPYYPYKEPADMTAAPGRKLNVYVLAPMKARAYLTEGADKKEWGHVSYAKPISDAAALLAGVLAPARIPAGQLWLTVFHDMTSRRAGGAELFFEKAGDQSMVGP